MAENISERMSDSDNSFNQFLQSLYQKISQRKELVLIVILTFVALILQIYFAMRTWGMIHPDEVLQSLEISHQLVFGYANIPPEFRLYNIHFPNYAQCRSHLFPLIFSIPMYLGRFFGWNYWKVTIPIIRFFLGVNGALLTPSTFLLVKEYTNGKTRFAFASAFIVTFSPLIMFLSFRSITNVFFLPWIFFIVTLYWKDVKKLKEKNKNEISSSFQRFRPYFRISIYTLLLGLFLYIRIDLTIILFAILVFKFPYKKIKILFSHLIGLAIAIVIGGAVDNYYYGNFLVSPVHWFTFNVIEGYSAAFGEEPFSFYFMQIVNYIPILLIVCYCILFLLVLFSINLWRQKQKSKANWEIVGILSSYIASSCIILFFFSFIDHKEIRFVYVGYLYFHIAIAIAFMLTLELIIPKFNSFITRFLRKRNQNISSKTKKILSAFYSTFFLIIIIVGIAIATYQAMQIVDWKEADIISRGLAFVGESEDSTGVIVIIRKFIGAYYCYLHKNIRIIEFRNLGTYSSIHTLARYAEEIAYQYNYVIVPNYQIEETPEIINILEGNYYINVKNIKNEGFIYKYLPIEDET